MDVKWILLIHILALRRNQVNNWHRYDPLSEAEEGSSPGPTDETHPHRSHHRNAHHRTSSHHVLHRVGIDHERISKIVNKIKSQLTPLSQSSKATESQKKPEVLLISSEVPLQLSKFSEISDQPIEPEVLISPPAVDIISNSEGQKKFPEHQEISKISDVTSIQPQLSPTLQQPSNSPSISGAIPIYEPEGEILGRIVIGPHIPATTTIQSVETVKQQPPIDTTHGTYPANAPILPQFSIQQNESKQYILCHARGNKCKECLIDFQCAFIVPANVCVPSSVAWRRFFECGSCAPNHYYMFSSCSVSGYAIIWIVISCFISLIVLLFLILAAVLARKRITDLIKFGLNFKANPETKSKLPRKPSVIKNKSLKVLPTEEGFKS